MTGRDWRGKKEIELEDDQEMAEEQRNSVGSAMKTDTSEPGWPMPFVDTTPERTVARASRSRLRPI
jgi:hypothetical protein